MVCVDGLRWADDEGNLVGPRRVPKYHMTISWIQSLSWNFVLLRSALLHKIKLAITDMQCYLFPSWSTNMKGFWVLSRVFVQS